METGMFNLVMKGAIESMSPDLAAMVGNQLPEEIRVILGTLSGKGAVGGGFIRFAMGYEDAPNDIDLFFTDSISRSYAATMLEEVGYRKTNNSPNAYTFIKEGCIKVQLVGRWFFSLREHVARFDFSICQACVYIEDGLWEGWLSNSFQNDCEKKILTYTQPERDEEPLGSIRRALRFASRGYELPVIELGKLQMQIHKNLADTPRLDVLDVWVTLSARAGGNY
jgi:hypothetical protein